ncbi:helix-turn-helix domain-containing protein [Aquibium sp. A9E412]|uniref:helix-turn-helix domain-containing protein n=1 Tax=Aquibium sp. A9E412 TaxID=2976767 RepID=UPI0025B24810|nr:helix-turn-helix domain-containing protein [Aquibium sp. A9E412]MDN2566803.1 helix-turn-helix domain-containing protein [Aquibium sp. A9E412]
MKTVNELKKGLMQDARFRAAYAEADTEYAVIEALVRARMKARLSQAELARRIGTTQSAIARLEGGGVSPTLATLRRYAEATGTVLRVDLVKPDP